MVEADALSIKGVVSERFSLRSREAISVPVIEDTTQTKDDVVSASEDIEDVTQVV